MLLATTLLILSLPLTLPLLRELALHAPADGDLWKATILS
jgi:hypothetical protein